MESKNIKELSTAEGRALLNAIGVTDDHRLPRPENKRQAINRRRSMEILTWHPLDETEAKSQHISEAPVAKLVGCLIYAAKHYGPHDTMRELVQHITENYDNDTWGGDLDCAGDLLLALLSDIAATVNPFDDVLLRDSGESGPPRMDERETLELQAASQEFERLQRLAQAASLKIALGDLGHHIQLSFDRDGDANEAPEPSTPSRYDAWSKPQAGKERIKKMREYVSQLLRRRRNRYAPVRTRYQASDEFAAAA